MRSNKHDKLKLKNTSNIGEAGAHTYSLFCVGIFNDVNYVNLT